MPKKIAVVLMNLGGPDNLDAVKPFLFNLFSDKAILRLPQPFRWLLARYIVTNREEEAKHIYSQIGGASPILSETMKQATSLEQALIKDAMPGTGYKVFITMRYWHPFVDETMQQVMDYAPDEIILLPLYPQFSTTTTLSSFTAWEKAASRYPAIPTRKICCYPDHPLFIQSHVTLLQTAYAQASQLGRVKILFSAHGLPQKIVSQGDPYPKQIEKTCKAVIEGLGIKNLDWKLCYQSKVGRLAWLEPSIDTEINIAAHKKKVIIVVPVSFVSEHSETLVELDIQYKKQALDQGAVSYIRVPALGTEPHFIQALAQLSLLASRPSKQYSCLNSRVCPYQKLG